MTAEERKYLKRTYDAERKSAERYYDHGIVAIEDLLIDDDSDEGKNELFSDGGKGAQDIYDAVSAHLDGEIDNAEDDRVIRRRRDKTAVEWISRNIPKCLPTFSLIKKNGKNRKASIWTMMKKSLANSSDNTAKNTTISGKSTATIATPCSTISA